MSEHLPPRPPRRPAASLSDLELAILVQGPSGPARNEATSELDRRYGAQLRRFAERLVPGYGEDIVQETMEKLILGAFRVDGPLKPWLFRVAHNAAVSRVRYLTVRGTVLLDDAQKRTVHETDELAEQRDELARVVGAAGQLSPVHRMVLAAQLNDLSLDDAAARRGVTRNAERVERQRMVRALRKRTGGDCGAPAERTRHSAR